MIIVQPVGMNVSSNPTRSFVYNRLGVIRFKGRFNYYKQALPMSPAETPISNVKVKNISSADQAGFTQRIVVKNIIKSQCLLT